MTLEDIYEQLSVGEFRLLFLGEGGEAIDGMPPEKYKEMLPSVKLGLTQLHKKFFLREGTLILQRIPGKISYMLDRKHAVSNTASTATKWLLDNAEPYQGDLLQVERVYDSEGNELSLNVRGDPKSLYTSAFNCLVVPEELTTETITIKYRADHPEISKYVANAAPQTVPIYLPASHLLALLYFIGSRVMNPTGMSGTFHEGNNYAMKFEQECAELLNSGLASVEKIEVFDRRYNAGWP